MRQTDLWDEKNAMENTGAIWLGIICAFIVNKNENTPPPSIIFIVKINIVDIVKKRYIWPHSRLLDRVNSDV